jgi:hypothetical protein
MPLFILKIAVVVVVVVVADSKAVWPSLSVVHPSLLLVAIYVDSPFFL